MATFTEPALWERLIAPERPDLTPEVARYFLSLDFPESDRERMNELATKGQHGRLTEEEEAAVENYRNLGHMLALLQAKARHALQKANLTP